MSQENHNTDKKPVCVIVGAGPGNGAAFARRYSTEGYNVALLARSLEFTSELAQSLPSAQAFSCDVTDAGSIERAFAEIQTTMGEIDVLIYNAGSGVWGSIEDVSRDDFEQSWRINTFGAFVAARQVIPAMKRLGRGNIVFIGATASRRGGAKTVAFASAKAAQHSLAQSLARHLGPDGIHVSLIVIDGVVDLPHSREKMPDKPASFFIQPDDIAITAFNLTEQPRSAWTFELEVRPFQEVW